MKKRFVLILAMVLSITIMGCGNSEKEAESDSTTDNNAQIVEAADTEDKQTPEIENADDSSENVTKEEGIYVYNEESQISEIALSFH